MPFQFKPSGSSGEDLAAKQWRPKQLRPERTGPLALRPKQAAIGRPRAVQREDYDVDFAAASSRHSAKAVSEHAKQDVAAIQSNAAIATDPATTCHARRQLQRPSQNIEECDDYVAAAGFPAAAGEHLDVGPAQAQAGQQVLHEPVGERLPRIVPRPKVAICAVPKRPLAPRRHASADRIKSVQL